MKLDDTLQEWRARDLAFSRDPKHDSLLLADFLAAGEGILAALPTKQDRSAAELELASNVHGLSRDARRLFLSLHAEWLYDLLTCQCSLPKRIAELAYEAAGACPGLVPTRAQIEQESKLPQKYKEAREIDQGLLFQSWLAIPRVALHLMRSMLLPTARALGLLERFEKDGVIELDTVVLCHRDNAGHITFHNTACLNAEDNLFVEDLETAVDLVLLSQSIKVGVMRGGIMTHPRYAGHRVFSAGINLKHLNGGKISFVDFLLRREFGFINKLLRGLRPVHAAASDRGPFLDFQKPWLAAVDTFAIGGGAQLLLAFDRVLAAEGSYVTLPAAQEGIVPGFSNLRLTRAVGARMARQILLFGRKLWAGEVDARFVIDEVVNAASMEEAIARNVADLSAPAVIANRHMLNISEEPIETTIHYAADFAFVQAIRLYSEDVLNKTRFAR
ncbi:enoyl-CoA hydratase/isomerase family protein [Dyella humi]|uniref:Enoyl-CoA hydratase/isomerase family protein n=1 Tax=Dyella humi TaxID=1770547 RepID=A0ABW8ID99_9GAMM